MTRFEDGELGWSYPDYYHYKLRELIEANRDVFVLEWTDPFRIVYRRPIHRRPLYRRAIKWSKLFLGSYIVILIAYGIMLILHTIKE